METLFAKMPCIAVPVRPSASGRAGASAGRRIHPTRAGCPICPAMPAIHSRKQHGSAAARPEPAMANSPAATITEPSTPVARPVAIAGKRNTAMKVMIIDDDQEFTDELAELMRGAGYAVTAYSDGVTALNAVNRDKPEVILLDLKLDQLAGHQVAWHLKSFPEAATIPVIGMSAYTSDDDPLRLAAAYGMNAFLKKPFIPLDIIARIESLAGSRPAAGPAGTGGRQAAIPAPPMQVQP